MKLVIGLGNPGNSYSLTRHNVGYMCIDHISRETDIHMSEKKQLAIIGQGMIKGHPVVLAKPRLFMNNSGEAFPYLLNRFNLSSNDIIVVYDDLHLPMGKVRVRPSGSAGGHNGLKSIISALGTSLFPRIKIGIGSPEEDTSQVRYVLGAFNPNEIDTINNSISTVAKIVSDTIAQGLDWTMNHYN